MAEHTPRPYSATVEALVHHATDGIRYASPDERRLALAKAREAVLAAHSLPEGAPTAERVYATALAAATEAAERKLRDMFSPTPTEDEGDGAIGYAVWEALRAYERAALAPTAFGAETLPESQAWFFTSCLGGTEHRPAVHGASRASHPATVNEAYELAKSECPVAADVIAALVWRLSIVQNNNAFAWSAALDGATQDGPGD